MRRVPYRQVSSIEVTEYGRYRSLLFGKDLTVFLLSDRLLAAVVVSAAMVFVVEQQRLQGPLDFLHRKLDFAFQQPNLAFASYEHYQACRRYSPGLARTASLEDSEAGGTLVAAGVRLETQKDLA